MEGAGCLTRRKRRIRAAVEEAEEDGTSAELSAELLAGLGAEIAIELELTEEQGTRLDWYVRATRGRVAET